MAEITAQVVNEFRKKTGLGLMECKKLLQEAEGDPKKAETLAKERGMKQAELRPSRPELGLLHPPFLGQRLGLLGVALGFLQELLALHESQSGLLAKLIDHLSRDLGHRQFSSNKLEFKRQIRDSARNTSSSRSGGFVASSRLGVRFHGRAELS